MEPDIEDFRELPVRNSNGVHNETTILESFMTSNWCEKNRFLDTEVTRSDKLLRKIFGWETVPGQGAFDLERFRN